MNCRSCKKLLTFCFIELGIPPSNSYLTEKELNLLKYIIRFKFISVTIAG